MLEEKDSLIAQQNKRIAELERDMGLMNKVGINICVQDKPR